MAALSNSLNYNDLKRKAVSARNYRATFQSSSGLTFGSNSSFSINLGQIPRSYIDPQMYLMFELSSTAGADNAVLDYSAYSLFPRITVSSGNGAVISDVNYLDIYHTLLLQSQTSDEFHKGFGKLCIGNAGRPNCPFGMTVGATKKIICLPLLTGLATSNKLIPLDVASQLQFTFYVGDFNKFLVPLTGVALSDITITNPRLVANVTELSEATQQMLDSSLQGVGYNINFKDVVSTTASRTSGSGTMVHNLAFRNSSLNKLTTIIQAAPAADNAPGNFSISNRSKGGLKEISFFIAGQRMPSQKLSTANNSAEIHIENVLANRSLMDPTHHSSLNTSSNSQVIEAPGGNAAANIVEKVNELRTAIPHNGNNFEVQHARAAGKRSVNGGGAGDAASEKYTMVHFAGSVAADLTVTAPEYGSFFSTYSFETFKSPADDSGIYSGVNCLGATTQAELVFDDQTANVNQTIFFYGEVDKVLSLDEITRSFIISD